MQQDITFLVFADLHVDIMPDSLARVQAALAAARSAGAAFAVQLGDLTYPDEDFLLEHLGKTQDGMDPMAFRCDRNGEKRELLRLLQSCGLPVYHTLGNHECDACGKEGSMAYLGMTAPYYSFDCGGFHFVVLDANFMEENGAVFPYENCSYQYHPHAAMPFLPQEQLDWLEEDVRRAAKPTVLFSHQSLTNTQLGIRNFTALEDVLRRLNTPCQRVLLCANGHAHIDGVCRRDGVYYWDVNSISNIWLGKKYACVRGGPETDQRYLYLKSTAPYRDPLFAMVTLTPERAIIRGQTSVFDGPSPYDLGFSRTASEYESTAAIADRVLLF